jgi:hypothetical protein
MKGAAASGLGCIEQEVTDGLCRSNLGGEPSGSCPWPPAPRSGHSGPAFKSVALHGLSVLPFWCKHMEL